MYGSDPTAHLAQTLGMISIVILIALPAIILLTTWSASYVPLMGASERIAHRARALRTGFTEWLNEHLDANEPAPAPPAYREPADPDLVDALADRVRGRAIVVHDPDPQPVDNPRRYASPSFARAHLAALVAEGQRYVRPALPAARVPAPVEVVGRHRRELVAA